MRFFKPSEFTMDGKNVFDKMDTEFLSLLYQCREQAGVPFIISSCYRTPSKNRKVGGSVGSLHLKGRAVDVICTMGETRAKIIRAALGLGMSVGVMQNALHLDNRAGQIVFHYYK